MEITYGIITECHETGKSKRISYGVAAYSNVEENGSACVLYAARDISDSRTAMEMLAERLNREEASVLHFEELITDYLAGN